MEPLKIYFKITKIGNGKFLKTRDEVNNLIVEVIDKNPSKTASVLRELALESFKNEDKAQKAMQINNFFFISKIEDIEIIVTFLPNERLLQEQFYTQWRYVQISEPYRLVQYLDEHKLIVYSEKTKVLHMIKLDKDVVVVVADD
ncbi:hypothetical protein [Pedobacter sp. MC2016-24]|uniref:hypothetical protein n=1 Tax=Pedobacter sp. MC2016-24 TaxID=2780090 RepID=UPI00188089B6|nr:hypothetical protein [Pedobacter sp. MC2016-24]MBE9599276.1 hypothetical protein [Pedobacter sp. MC2016-24]